MLYRVRVTGPSDTCAHLCFEVFSHHQLDTLEDKDEFITLLGPGICFFSHGLNFLDVYPRKRLIISETLAEGVNEIRYSSLISYAMFKGYTRLIFL